MKRKSFAALLCLVMAVCMPFASFADASTKIRLLFVFDAGAMDYLNQYNIDYYSLSSSCVTQMNKVLENSRLIGTDNLTGESYNYFEYELAGATTVQACNSETATAWSQVHHILLGDNTEDEYLMTGMLQARYDYAADIIVMMINNTSGRANGNSEGFTNVGSEAAINFAGLAVSVCAVDYAVQEATGQFDVFPVCSHEVAHTMGCGHPDTQDYQSNAQSAPYSFGYQFKYPGNDNYTVRNGQGIHAWYGCTVMGYKERFFKNADGSYMSAEDVIALTGWTNTDDREKLWDNTDGSYGTKYGRGIFTMCNMLPYFSSPDYCFVNITGESATVVPTSWATAHYDVGTYVPMGDEKHNNRQVLIDNYQYASRWHLGVKFSKDGNKNVVNGASDKITLSALSANCTIYYTTDGTEPTKSNGTQYTEPFSLTQAATIKARAYDAQDNAGDVLSKAYTMLPLATALGNTELTWTTSSPAWYVDNGVARSALINDDGVTSSLSTVIAGPAKLTFEYAAELMDSDVFAVTVGGTKVLEATEYNSAFVSSGEINIPEGEQTVVFSYTVNFNVGAENNIKLRNVSVQYESNSSNDPEPPAYTGPVATAVWQTGEFDKTKDDYAISLNGNTINDDGNIVIGTTVSAGVTIDIQSVLGNAGRDVSVLVKYSNASAPADCAVFACVYVDNNGSYDTGLATSAANAGTLVGYYNATSPYTMKSSGSNVYPNPAATGSGYLLFSYKHKTENDITKGVYAYNGTKLDSMTGGSNDGLCWPDRRLSKIAIGGPSGSISSTYAKWPNLVIEKVAIFVGDVLTNVDIAEYQFPELQGPEEPTGVARLVVGGETAGTYSTLLDALIALAGQLYTNPNAFVEVIDDGLETPNEYGSSGIGYSATDRKYAQAITKIDNGTGTYPAFLNLADAWVAAGKDADTATITILSEPSDSVTIGAGETLKVTGTALAEDKVFFGENLMHFTTTSGNVTTYTARNKGTTLPGINTNVAMTVGDFALDSSGEWAEIVDAPIRMTLDSPVRRFKLSFDVDIPNGYGTLFSWDSTNSTEAVDSRVVITNDASKMVIYRNKNGVLSTVDYSDSTLITSGQHTITVTWVHNTGCTIYVDGNKCYSSSNLAFTDHDTTTLAIGGSVLGGPVDALAGLKVRNFTYNVYSDEVTRLDGTVYHGNDANRAVITNYLSQMVGHRPVKMPAPNTVDLLIVYDKPSAEFILDAGQTLEEHAAVRIARMNRILTTTDIDTNVWFRLAGVYTLNVAAPSVYAAMDLVRIGTAEGWTEVSEVRDSVGADVVLAVAHEHDADGYARWCNPEGIRNGSAAAWAFAGVHHGYDEGIGWAWVHEVGHLASLYHNMSAAADENNPNYIGCGFGKTTEADDVWVSSIMNYGTGQLAFSSKNHMSHGEIYSVTNGVGEYLDSTGVLAELLPCMANYRDTKVNAWSVTPQSGSTATAGDTMTVTCEDPEATIWYSRYGEEDTQYTGPVAINTSSSWCIYNITIKKGDETVGTSQVAYTVNQPQTDPVAQIGDTPYDTLAAAVAAATASPAESVAISLLQASADNVTLDAKTTVTEASAGLYTGTLSGSGTLVLAGTRTASLSFGTWTGTVVLPTDLTTLTGFRFDYYGISGSTIRLASQMSGWIQRKSNQAPLVVEATVEIPATASLTISDFSPSFKYAFTSLKGCGTFAVTATATQGNQLANAATWTQDFSAYVLVTDVSGFTGTMTVTGDAGIAVGFVRPGKNTVGGKILLTSADAALTVQSASPTPTTTVADHYVKATSVAGGTKYVVAEIPTGIDPASTENTELDVPGDATEATAQVAADDMVVQVTSDVETVLATAGVDPDDYQAYFTKTAVKNDTTGAWEVQTSISEAVQEAVSEDATENLLAAIESTTVETVTVDVPVGLYYKVETFDTLGGTAIDTKSGLSSGTTTPVAKPTGAGQGFIRVTIGAAEIN